MRKSITDKTLWEEGYKKKESVASRLGHTRQNAVFREIVDYVDRIIRTNFQNPASLQILELGGGNSDWLCYWGERYGCGLWAIDYSVKGCELLSQKLRRRGLACEVINKNFLDLDGSEVKRPIDLFFSAGLLEHFVERAGIYRLADGVLAPGGFFVAAVPNLNGLNLRWCLRVQPALMSWHVSLRLSEIITELKSHRFEEVHGRFIGGLRLFADPKDIWFWIAKKGINMAGELISRVADLSSEKVSPFYIVSGRKPDRGPGLSSGERA